MHTLSFLLAAVSLVSAKPLDARFKSSYSGGDITFYEGGLTACGATIDTNSDKTVAVSFNVFDTFPGAGANSNKNPICKTRVKATINGVTQTLLVQDSCSACADADLDLTQAAWDAFGVARSVGRKSGLKWEFIGVGGGDSSDDSSATTSTKKAAATTSTKKAEATTSTKKEETASKTSSSSKEPSQTPAIAVSGGAVDSSADDSSDSNDTSSSSTTSSSAATETSASSSSSDAGSSSDSSSDAGSSSGESSNSGSSSDNTSDAGSDSSAADTATPSATESSAPSESSPAAVSGGSFDECNTAWTACNSKFKGTKEDLASYSCQTEYVSCVNAAMGKSERRRSLRRHIAHSRLESF